MRRFHDYSFSQSAGGKFETYRVEYEARWDDMCRIKPLHENLKSLYFLRGLGDKIRPYLQVADMSMNVADCSPNNGPPLPFDDLVQLARSWIATYKAQSRRRGRRLSLELGL